MGYLTIACPTITAFGLSFRVEFVFLGGGGCMVTYARLGDGVKWLVLSALIKPCIPQVTVAVLKVCPSWLPHVPFMWSAR